MEYSYNKANLRKLVHQYFQKHHVDYHSRLTNRLLEEGFAFVDGFVSCLKFMAEDPISLKEVDALILTELINFMIRRLDEKEG